jgi:hypothetical protein
MRRSLYSLFLGTFIFNGFWLIPVAAQEHKGTIAGRVLDPNQGALMGARIALQPAGHTVVSDDQGQFSISDMAPGKYTLVVLYMGFAPFSKEVTLASGEVSNLEAVLQVEGANQRLIVRGERERGEIGALNRERTADNIVQVLPAEVITSLPNTNIADAVGRLPSVSLERDEGEGKYVQIRGRWTPR